MTTKTEGPVAAEDGDKGTWTAEVLPGWDALQLPVAKMPAWMRWVRWLAYLMAGLSFYATYLIDGTGPVSLADIAIVSAIPVLLVCIANIDKVAWYMTFSIVTALCVWLGWETSPSATMMALSTVVLPVYLVGPYTLWKSTTESKKEKAEQQQLELLNNWEGIAYRHERVGEAGIQRVLGTALGPHQPMNKGEKAYKGPFYASDYGRIIEAAWQRVLADTNESPLNVALRQADAYRYRWTLTLHEHAGEDAQACSLGEVNTSEDYISVALLGPDVVLVWRDAGETSLCMATVDWETGTCHYSHGDFAAKPKVGQLLLPAGSSPLLLVEEQSGQAYLLGADTDSVHCLPAPQVSGADVYYTLLEGGQTLQMQQLDRKTGTVHTALVPLQFAPSELADVA